MRPKELLKQSHSSNVAFHKFVLLHRRHRTHLFCFFEGVDSQYYFPRINSLEENHQPIVCGNKKAVIESHKLIKSKYNDFRTKFFVDADFDTNTEMQDLYITPSYSIENLYCTEKTVSNILKNELHFSVIDEEYNQVLSIFRNRQEEFHNSTALFNLWYFSIKKKAEALKTIPNVSLADKFPKEFITFSFENVEATYNLETIKLKFPNALDVSEDEILSYKKDFDTKPPIYRFRGKYEIEFLIKFLIMIIEDSNIYNKVIKRKTKFRVDPALILSQLTQYADTPECLMEFLKDQ